MCAGNTCPAYGECQFTTKHSDSLGPVLGPELPSKKQYPGCPDTTVLENSLWKSLQHVTPEASNAVCPAPGELPSWKQAQSGWGRWLRTAGAQGPGLMGH